MKHPPPPKESEITNAIRDWLAITGWFVHRPVQGARGVPATIHKGVADLYALRDGRHLWLEVKRPKVPGYASLAGVQSDHQRRFQADIESHGGEYYLVTSVEEVMALTNPNVTVKGTTKEGHHA